MALDDGKCFDNGLKPVVAAELQALEKGRQHAPIVTDKLPLHDCLPEQAQLRPAKMKLGYQVPEDLLFDSGEDDLAYNPVWVLDHSFGDVGENLHLAFDTFEVS